MSPVNGEDSGKVLSVVLEALQTVAPGAGAAGADTYLLGSQAVLDSVGFVTLLINLEQRLGNGVDLAASFLEQGSAAEQDNPFRTVGSLAEHVHQLLAARV